MRVILDSAPDEVPGELRFNYHDLPREGFLAWFYLSLIAGHHDDKAWWEWLERVTNKGRDIRIAITINGIPVDAERVVERIEQNTKWKAARMAVEKVKKIAGLEKVQEIAYDISRTLQRQFLKELRAQGIEISDDDWPY